MTASGTDCPHCGAENYSEYEKLHEGDAPDGWEIVSSGSTLTDYGAGVGFTVQAKCCECSQSWEFSDASL